MVINVTPVQRRLTGTGIAVRVATLVERARQQPLEYVPLRSQDPPHVAYRVLEARDAGDQAVVRPIEDGVLELVDRLVQLLEYREQALHQLAEHQIVEELGVVSGQVGARPNA